MSERLHFFKYLLEEDEPDFCAVSYWKDPWGRQSIWEQRWRFWFWHNMWHKEPRECRMTKIIEVDYKYGSCCPDEWNWDEVVAFPWMKPDPNVFYLGTLTFTTCDSGMHTVDHVDENSLAQLLRFEFWGLRGREGGYCDVGDVFDWLLMN